MEVHILASGSKGNLTYIKSEKTHILIDAGISFLKIKEKFNQINQSLNEVEHLLITHEHIDHIKGLKMLLKQANIKHLYLTKGTLDVLPKDIVSNLSQTVHVICADQLFKINHLDVLPFMLSHDASEPVGFKVEGNKKSMVLLTDTGYVDQSYIDILKGADLYILEANHDPVKLMKSARPFLLKKRIMGERGHLSNQDAAWLIDKLVRKNEKSIWVAAHISEDCNTALDIEIEVVNTLDDPTKIQLFISSQESLPVIKL